MNEASDWWSVSTIMTSPSPGNQSLTVMTCDQFKDHVDEQLRQYNGETYSVVDGSMSAEELRFNVISDVISRYIEPSICMLGVLGNLLNLIVLTRKRLQRRLVYLRFNAS